jgi:cytochrome b subunit of formate dehydrogenase
MRIPLKMSLLYLASILLLSDFSLVAKECMECHNGDDGPEISVKQSSVHADLDCTDCHQDVTDPHQEQMPVVSCSECHDSVVDVFLQSSHAQGMARKLGVEPNKNTAKICLACHGGDAHGMMAVSEKGSGVNKSEVPESCLSCHKDVASVNASNYLESVHGQALMAGNEKAANCKDCHGAHDIMHSRFETSRTNHTNIPSTCRECHQKEYLAYTESSHWALAKKGYREAPICTDCHGEHLIRAHADENSATFKTRITETCSTCHASEKIIRKFNLPLGKTESFMNSFHGLSGRLGDQSVANCASCHDNHKVLPASSPESSIHPNNLSKTCGTCHEGIDGNSIKGSIHGNKESDTFWLIPLVEKIYIFLILATVGGMLFHNFLDLLFKMTRGKPYKKKRRLFPRFTKSLRFQHFVMASCFMFLTWSGFALAYPESWIAAPFVMLPHGIAIRSWGHRIAALLFCLIGAYHLLYLLFHPHGRKVLKSFLPGPQDLRDAYQVMLKYLRLSNKNLIHPQFNYVEKVEYWALIWGSIVMTITGGVLLFNNLALKFLPLWIIELATLIHFWEAVLAGLAILIWHGYWVVFDPDHYPMNMTWLVGEPRSHLKKGKHQVEKSIEHGESSEDKEVGLDDEVKHP